MAYIYKISNDINDHVYIGLTFYNPQIRWKMHLHDRNHKMCRERPLYKAINKYGVEHFYVETIEECDDSVVNEREIFWIKYYNSYHNGYNATYGGEGKPEYSVEDFYDLYQAGMTIYEIAQIKNCDTSTVSRYLTTAGIDTLKEHENRMKERYGKKCRGFKDDVQVEFLTLSDAARYIKNNGLSSDTISGIQTHIGHVCNGKRKTAYGYRWKYIYDS